MKIITTTAMLTAVLVAALVSPAVALDYDCSPYGTGCVPAQSRSIYEPPPVTIYVPPWPRNTCPIDGPQAWSCGRERERRR
jgi:hypothetical protein